MDPSRQTQSSFRGTTTVPERTELLCRVKYCNSLPDIPFDPKCIAYTFDQRRFVRYKPTSLENQHKHALLAETDLGVTIDLINRDAYRLDPSVALGPADKTLLEEDVHSPFSSKRSLQHAKVVPWMRKTEYISTEVNRYGVSNGRAKDNIAEPVRQRSTEDIYKDGHSQISAIEKTFGDAQKPIRRHHSKAGVTPVEVLPVFPDFKMWVNSCAQVIFDSDPAPKNVSAPAGVEMMSQAMIRSMSNVNEDKFVGYFLPSEETLRKRKRDAEEEPDQRYDYNLAQEYNWEIKNKNSKDYEETYLFVFRDGDGVYFNELETRLYLGKRRRPNKAGGVRPTRDAVLVCKHREMNEEELQARERRRAHLENHDPKDKEDNAAKDLPGSGDEDDKSGRGGVIEEESEELEWEVEEEEEGEKRQRAATSGIESGENMRAMCDEIFGSDSDEDGDDDEHQNSAGSNEEEEEDEEEENEEEEYEEEEEEEEGVTKEVTNRVQGQRR